MEAAQMWPSPRSSGEGRFRASLAAILALRRAYSSSRCSVQNPSIHSSTGSTVARTALGMRNASACLVPELLARLLVTLSLLSVVATPGQHVSSKPPHPVGSNSWRATSNLGYLPPPNTPWPEGTSPDLLREDRLCRPCLGTSKPREAYA